ncbi:MAG: phosphotransferase [Elusimicrobia bacterium]|nr:phosphotransferase [Elusimicrobiota bacterium]
MKEERLQELYRSHFGEAPVALAPLKGDGSARRLFRISSHGRSVIGAANQDRQENVAFLEFSRHFRECGLPVPEIYAQDLDQGIYLEEDLGDTTLFDLLGRSRGPRGFSPYTVEFYCKVVKALPQFQVAAGRSLNYKLAYPRPSFDKQSMMWDLNYFKYYFLRLAKIPFNEQDLEVDFKRFADFLLEAPRKFFLYRDFQSRNIMVRDGSPWFIDYQGGRHGALQYDIASLLFDAKADMPFELRAELLERYIEAASAMVALDRGEFLKYYPGYVYIRIMQALGAYGLRGFYERKTHFLQSIPYAIRNLEHLLRTTELPVELPALMHVYGNLVASSALRQFGTASLKLTVRLQSFSYKDGMPADEKGHGGGFVFDCRALPNPGRRGEFAKLSGKDPEVIEYLKGQAPVNKFLSNVFELVDLAVENYQSRNFTDLLVAFGCTGGQHRSVYCAERLALHLRGTRKVDVELRHRELDKREEG